MNTNLYENANSETTKPLNKRRILPVFFIVALYAASTSAVMSVLPFYIREMGGSPLIIGVIIATEAFSQFCAAPLIGHLSDRVGRKRILIVTLAIAAISLLLLASAQCILFILLARTLSGISAGNLSAATAYIADHTHVRNRRQAIGILTGCIGLGGIVGAGVSGWLSDISLSAPIVCISIADALAKPTYLAALSVHVSSARQGIVIGTAQALIAIVDFISPVLGGFILGYALYGVWIGIAFTVAIIGLVTAMTYLSKNSPLIVKPETK
ncbi:MFS transporter [Salmonella enterica]|nr:MFS transporter [Salmonella enterica]EBR4764748.1 MFS transporter [Salmonella enterica]